jgi:transcriptional regulator with XRE-family HTH domain
MNQDGFDRSEPEFGAILRTWRQRRALSQRELASLAGLQQATLARLESGTRRPHPSTIRKLANALEVDLSEFV